MTIYTRMSAKGQVVVPKQQRDRLGWRPGSRLAVLEHPGAITFCAAPLDDGKISAAEAIAKMRARASYRGPRVGLEEMDDAVREVAAERHAAR